MVVRDAEGRPRRRAGVVADITETKLAAEALRISEERYAHVMEAAQDAHWDWIVGSDQYYTSPRVVDVFGFPPGTTFTSRQDYLARTPLLKEDLDVWQGRVRELFAGTGTRLSMDLRANIHGDVRWIQHHGFCVRDESGQPVRWCGSVRDVTERRRAVEALRLSEERYALAMQASAEGHFDWNVLTDDVFASDSLKALLGLPPDAMYRSRLEMLSRVAFHPGDAERVAQITREVLASSATQHEFEYRLFRSPGVLSWNRVRWKIMRGDDGVAQRIVGTVSDVTERKRIEEELRSRTEMLELAQRAAGAVPWSRDWRGGGRSEENQWSPELAAMFGIKAEDDSGTAEGWWNLLHPEDRARIKASLTHAVATGEVDVEYPVTHPDGSVHWLNQKGRVFVNQKGKPLRAIGFMFDVTERRKVQDDLRSRQEMLELAQKSARA